MDQHSASKFADVLHLRLRQLQGNGVDALHRRASVWYAQHGEREEAIHHASLAQAWSWAADLIEQQKRTRLSSRRDTSHSLRNICQKS